MVRSKGDVALLQVTEVGQEGGAAAALLLGLLALLAEDLPLRQHGEPALLQLEPRAQRSQTDVQTPSLDPDLRGEVEKLLATINSAG